MKRFLLIILFASFAKCSFGQENPDVYFDKNYRRNKQRTINLVNMAVSQQRWYFGIDGAFRISTTTLDNNLGGILGKNNNSDAVWSFQLGYNANNKWAVELGYAPTPIANILHVASGRGAISFNEGVTLQTIPIRYKKKIWTLDKETQTASIWVGGGLLLSPNSHNEQLNSYKQLFSTNIVRASDGKVTSFDTLKISENFFLTNRSLVQLEGSVELQGKIADGFYINLFFRGVYGQNGGVRTDIEYAINSVVKERASLYTNSFQYSFGLGFRFDYGKSVKYKSRLEE